MDLVPSASACLPARPPGRSVTSRRGLTPARALSSFGTLSSPRLRGAAFRP